MNVTGMPYMLCDVAVLDPMGVEGAAGTKSVGSRLHAQGHGGGHSGPVLQVPDRHAGFFHHQNHGAGRIEVHLLDADWLLKLQGRNGEPVTIDQSKGKFLTPMLDFTGRGLGAENHAENVSVNFDLTDFMSDCLDATCVNQFSDKANPKEQR